MVHHRDVASACRIRLDERRQCRRRRFYRHRRPDGPTAEVVRDTARARHRGRMALQEYAPVPEWRRVLANRTGA